MQKPYTPDVAAPLENGEISRLRDLSPQQWKSGIAAWLGWLFDGLDMHLYSVVATPFVAALLLSEKTDPRVKDYTSWIQAAFLIGWALGGGFFGRIGDKLGRSRALMLTILTYALFTGLSFFAQEWWHLLIFRFMAALGIGGEWAVGASLLSETWPKHWRPWMAATLQTAVNIGILFAMLCVPLLKLLPFYTDRCVFLIGILPALSVLWIRRAVPEPEEWHTARANVGVRTPRVADLFKGDVRRITLLTILVCSLSLTPHWAFMFWFMQHMGSLAEKANEMIRAGHDSGVIKSYYDPEIIKSYAMDVVMVAAIIGNYFGGMLAKWMGGFRIPIAILCVLYFLSMCVAYGFDWSLTTMWFLLPTMGFAGGVFALFTMYMPPLFPVLLRTTGAGFCYNIGRLAAAFGTVYFGLISPVGEYRMALFYAGFLFVPAALFALMLPEAVDETPDAEPVD